MPIYNTYTQELEDLVLNKLLPVYEDWCRQNNRPLNIPVHILNNLHKKANIAALLKKKPDA
jgi:hypothetical protein